jgi:hypothetical protein
MGKICPVPRDVDHVAQEQQPGTWRNGPFIEGHKFLVGGGVQGYVQHPVQDTVAASMAPKHIGHGPVVVGSHDGFVARVPGHARNYGVNAFGGVAGDNQFVG